MPGSDESDGSMNSYHRIMHVEDLGGGLDDWRGEE